MLFHILSPLKIGLNLELMEGHLIVFHFSIGIYKIICLAIEDILDLIRYGIRSKSDKSKNNRLNGYDKFMND